MAAKKRLDQLLVERGLAENATIAAAYIGAGIVVVDGVPGGKAGSLYDCRCTIEVRKKAKDYVSRGGTKLEAGLEFLGVDVRDWICADIGCSTGGFTDCLLKRGARKVYSVDVGYGVLDWQLRNDNRVVVLERTNARYLSRELVPDPLDLVVIDASFISLGLLLQPLMALFGGPARIMALVKPQFELPREKVGKGGVVREKDFHEEALAMVKGFGAEAGLVCRGLVASPICGAKGNQEFLMYLEGVENDTCKD